MVWHPHWRWECVELLENGTLCEPIPWDEACEQNITTSICDSDAIEEFRYVIQKDFPAAIFIGSDGIDDSYSSEMELHELYRNIFIVFAEHSTEVGNNEVRDYLPKITRRGSGDDVSIAGIIRTDLSEGSVAKIRLCGEEIRLKAPIRKGRAHPSIRHREEKLYRKQHEAKPDGTSETDGTSAGC